MLLSRALSQVETPGLIEGYLPDYTFGHRYDIVVDNGSLETVYEIARDVDLSRSKVILWLFRLRGLPTEKLTARAFTRAMGWSDIDQKPPAEFVIGYWRSRRIEPVTEPGRFASDTPGARQKVAFSFRFRALNPRQVKIETETRVLCIGAAEKLRFWPYWLAIRPFSGWVRKEVLKLIKEEAEARARVEPPAAAPPQPRLVFKVPAPVLWPMRLYFQLTGRLAPPLAAASFQWMMSAMPRKRLSGKERSFLQAARRLDIACDGATLAAYEFGQGPTVILVHGLMGSAANFQAMAPALAARGYRVVAFDALNHGQSPDGLTFSPRTLQHIRQVIASQGHVRAVISHSAGAYLAMMALLAPLPGSSVQRCVYIAPYPSIETTLRTFMRYFWVPEAVFPALARWIGELGGVPCEQQSLAACLPRHRTPEPPPCLFVHDADDVHIPLSHTKQALAQLPGAELFVTEGLGHFKVLRDETVIDRIARFLE